MLGTRQLAPLAEVAATLFMESGCMEYSIEDHGHFNEIYEIIMSIPYWNKETLPINGKIGWFPLPDCLEIELTILEHGYSLRFMHTVNAERKRVMYRVIYSRKI